jgi:hypothetical protein
MLRWPCGPRPPLKTSTTVEFIIVTAIIDRTTIVTAIIDRITIVATIIGRTTIDGIIIDHSSI